MHHSHKCSSILSVGGAWKLLPWRLQVVKSTIFLMAMSMLDVRDLWYKVKWVGPLDSYSFTTGSRGILQSTPLPNFTAESWTSTGTNVERQSGWASFFSRCDEISAFCETGSTFFLNTLGSNCNVDVLDKAQKVQRLVMTSSIRADSMAWAACELLYDHRKPLLCAQPIVTIFYERYRLRANPVPSKLTVAEGSSAETELLELLSLIARSFPHHKMICVSGFVYTTPGKYQPSIYGCASANLFEAAFVDLYASQFNQLQYNMAWLATMDVVSVAGLTYGIRQNGISQFNVAEEATTSSNPSVIVSVTEHTKTNFVSYGLLYLVMIFIDFLLLVAQMYTGYELVQLWIIPLIENFGVFEIKQEEMLARSTIDRQSKSQKPPQHQPILFSQEEYMSFLSISLFRHHTFVMLTVITQLLSWGIVIPNSIIWIWSLSNLTKIQGYLSSVRLWVLIVVIVNAIWDIVAFIDERRAFVITHAVFISPFEVMIVGAICAYHQRGRVMDISETKFAHEKQRVTDFETFPGYIAFGNTFNIGLDGSFGFDSEMVSIIYGPLASVMMQSVVGVVTWLVFRYSLHHVASRVAKLRCMQPLIQQYHVIPVKHVSVADIRHREESDTIKNLDPIQILQIPETYRRTPLETLLNTPMRARSLIRPAKDMQKLVSYGIIVRPFIAIDYGVIVSHGVVMPQTGFVWVIPAKTRLPKSSDFGKSMHISQLPLQIGDSEIKDGDTAHPNDFPTSRGGKRHTAPER